MKKNINMPNEEERKYTIIPEGEYRFQVVDIKDETDVNVRLLCEIVGGQYEGRTVLHNVPLEGDFLWLTKLFLKCIGEPHCGDIQIDTDNWIGRQFTGQVKHSKDGKYANIKTLIYQDIAQPKKDGDIDWGN